MSKVIITIDGKSFEVEVNLSAAAADSMTVLVDGEAVTVAVPDLGHADQQIEWIIVDNRPYELVVDPSLHWIKAFDGLHRLEIHDKSATLARAISGDGRVKAPIPGLVTQVLVSTGEPVEAGQPLLLLEAMKMENEILAPRSGTVAEVKVKPSQSVQLHEVLVEIV